MDDFREMKNLLKEQEKMLKELRDDLKDGMRRLIEQFAARLKLDAPQPRRAMEADGPADAKTRERTESAATAVQAMRGDGFSARRVEPGPNTDSTSFGVKAEPSALSCKDARSPTAAGGLVPTGEASTATETNSNQPPLRFCSTKGTDLEARNSWTSVPSASYDSSSVFQERNLSATPYYRRIVGIKSRQNRPFDPGRSQRHLRACPCLGPWRALACGEGIRAGAAGDKLQRYFGGDSLADRKKGRF